MTENRTETAKRLLAKELDKLTGQERPVVERFINRDRSARTVTHEFEAQVLFGQRARTVSLRSSGRGGSLSFKVCC